MDKETAEAIKKILLRVNENSRRLRILEESIERNLERYKLLEDEMLAALKDLKVSLERTSLRLQELNNRLEEINSKVAEMSEKLKKKVDRDELKELEEYISIIKPIAFKKQIAQE